MEKRPRFDGPGPSAVRCALALALACLASASASAQGTPPPHYAPAAAAVTGTASSALPLLVGRSALIDVPRPITRVSLTMPDVADAIVTAPHQLLVQGKAPGKMSLLVWDESENVATYEVVVQRDLTELTARIAELFAGEPIRVSANGRDVVLAGTVSSKYVIDKATEVAAGYVESRENIVNLLRQQEGIRANQVMLRVRFAEVSRSALTELGASLFTGPNGYKDMLGRTTTQQFAAPFYDEQNGRSLVFSDFLNLFLFDTDSQLGAVIRALQSRGLFQSLAEPNLIAQNGREASFLAGGEYPYPAVQGGAANLAVTVAFKEFGIRLSFTPTILDGESIHLKVRPEVSALDFSNAVTIQGFRIPALTSRRAETEVELRDGQTFAIAGLLNNSLTQTMQKIPGLGDIPILGLLFRSKALQKAETELVVMITPQIVRANSPGVASELPALQEPFLERPTETLPPPPPHGGDAAAVPTAPTLAPGPPARPTRAAGSSSTEKSSGTAVAAPSRVSRSAARRPSKSSKDKRSADPLARLAPIWRMPPRPPAATIDAPAEGASADAAAAASTSGQDDQ